MSEEQKRELEDCYGQIEVLTIELGNTKAALERANQEIEEQQATIQFLEEQIEQGAIYDENYIDSEATAKLLGVKIRTIRKYNNEGKLTARKYTKTGRLYFPLKQVLRLRREKFRHWASFE